MTRKEVVKALLNQFKFNRESLVFEKDSNIVYIKKPNKTDRTIAVGYNAEHNFHLLSLSMGSYGWVAHEVIRLTWWEKRKAKKIYTAVEIEAIMRRLTVEEQKEKEKYERFLTQAGLGVNKNDNAGTQ